VKAGENAGIKTLIVGRDIENMKNLVDVIHD
jgi:hypothetical protein